MANAIWATWYNLDERDRQGFQGWLHEAYLPAMQKSPRLGWVAHFERKDAPPQSERKADGSLVIGHTREDIGTGQDFLIVGAPTPRAFLDPLFLDAQDDLVAGAKERLAARRGTRQVLFLEQQCVTGQAAGAAEHPPYPGPVIQFGSYRMQSFTDEFEVATWYERNRLQFMARATQCIRTLEVGVAGWAKHGVIYEFTSVAARNALWEAARKAKASGDPAQAWGISDRTMHTPGSPIVAERTFAAMCQAG